MRVMAAVLLGPKAEGSDWRQQRIWGRSLNSIMRLEWSEPIDYVLMREDRPTQGAYDNILKKYQAGRRMALDGGYDAMLCLESDMVVPPDALLRLAAIKEADVAYGLSCNRRRKNWLCATSIAPRSVTWLSQDPDLARANWGRTFPSFGAGLGCTLIWRHVLEAVEFRRESGGPSNDWYFALDLTERGYRQVHDLGCIVGHITTYPAPMVVWPSNRDNLFETEWMEGVTVEPLKPGESLQVPLGETIELYKVEGEGDGLRIGE